MSVSGEREIEKSLDLSYNQSKTKEIKQEFCLEQFKENFSKKLVVLEKQLERLEEIHRRDHFIFDPIKFRFKRIDEYARENRLHEVKS